MTIHDDTSQRLTDAADPGTPTERYGRPAAVVVILGAIAAALTAVLVTQTEIVLSTIRVGIFQFPPVALGFMMFAVMLNRAAKRISRNWGLTSSDLLIIYSMMVVAALVSSHGIVQRWIPLLVVPKYFATTLNGWHGLYDPHIQSRLVPYDTRSAAPQAVAVWYYEGAPHGASIPWAAWIQPLLSWGVLIALVVFAFLCLAAILRRQWVESERLSFPLTQVPIEIAGDEESHSFFRRKALWFGILIPSVVYTVKAVHQSFPSVPDIPLFWDTAAISVMPPWNSASCTYLLISFGAIGFFFLLPVDMLFSIWFFFLLTRVQMVGAAYFNFSAPWSVFYPVPQFLSFQTVGAYFVLAGYLLWLERPHLRKVAAAALGRGAVDDSNELIPYRVAVWGLLGSYVASSVYLWSMGMSLWIALFELGIFVFVTAVVIARSTAEAGLLMTETSFRPTDVYAMFGHVSTLGPTNITLLAFVDHLLFRDQRGLVLTGMLDAARISDSMTIRRRSLAGLLMVGIAVSVVVAVALNIYLPYRLGAGTLDRMMEQSHPSIAFNYYSNILETHAGSGIGQSQMLMHFAIGAVVTFLLTVLRSTFHWWPLLPLGYAISPSWGVVEFWFSCFVAWSIKALVVRYGGTSAYSRVRPFFLGLVIGEFGIMLLLALLNVTFHIPPPQFPWT